MAETDLKDAHASLTRRVFDHVRRGVVCPCCAKALSADAHALVLPGMWLDVVMIVSPSSRKCNVLQRALQCSQSSHRRPKTKTRPRS